MISKSLGIPISLSQIYQHYHYTREFLKIIQSGGQMNTHIIYFVI